MAEIKKTGGARIGLANATWPFATLTVNQNKLELNATILGNFVFTPNDIISIEPYGLIPLIGKGIKINHRVNSYNSKMIFWTMSNPKELINEINHIGFLTNSSPIPEELQREVRQAHNKGGFPIKTKAAIAIIVIWNLLFSIDFIKAFRDGMEGSPLGIGAKLAISFLLLTCILLLNSNSVRKLILKEGHSIKNIKKFIYFIMLICGFIILNLSFLPH